MKKKFKKSLVSMLMVVALTLMLAIPASAASYNYTFFNPDTGLTSTHASGFINGPAEVTGTPGNYTVKIKLYNWYQYVIPVSYSYLHIDANYDATDGYEVVATKTDSTFSYTEFTFTGVDNVTDNLPVKLMSLVVGVHESPYELEIKFGS